MSNTPLVVLLHGLARRQGSLGRLAQRLEAAGYETWARTYPSRSSGIAAAARTVADWIADVAADRPLHAVTHSLGGILIRHMHDPRLRWQRIVMVAPPNQGSAVASTLSTNPIFRWFYGPAGSELADGNGWPAPPAPFAVIAGNRSRALVNPVSWTVGAVVHADEPSDGTVRVAETRLPGMEAFAEVDATHTVIMDHPQVARYVLSFLESGRFGP